MAKKNEEKSAAPAAPAKMGRRQQLVETYRITKRSDATIGRRLLAVFVVAFALGFGLFYLLPGQGVLGYVLAVIGGLLIASLATMIVFSRRAQNAAYSQMEGQPGAGAAALQMLRRGWQVTPAVAFTRQQDVVHRVVGPPGIVLVGEGNTTRVRTLLTAERRKHERVVADTPVYEVVVGREDGQVPLPKLMRHVQKLGRKIKPAEQTDVLARLRALDSTRSNIPLPKGPVPTNMKGMRQNMRGR